MCRVTGCHPIWQYIPVRPVQTDFTPKVRPAPLWICRKAEWLAVFVNQDQDIFIRSKNRWDFVRIKTSWRFLRSRTSFALVVRENETRASQSKGETGVNGQMLLAATRCFGEISQGPRDHKSPVQEGETGRGIVLAQVRRREYAEANACSKITCSAA